MNEVIDLTKGGIAVVLIGNTGMVKEYATNPAVRFIDTKETGAELLASLVPDNTKVAILTDGIPNYHYTWITSYCRRKSIPFIVRKSNEAIYQYLKSCFPNGNGNEAKPSVEEIKQAVRGKYEQFLPLDFTKSNAEIARELERKCKEKGISYTFGALAQWVGNKRRASGNGSIPKSARPKLDVSVDILDEMVRNLNDMRDFLIAVTEENRILKAKQENLKKIMEAMQ